MNQNLVQNTTSFFNYTCTALMTDQKLFLLAQIAPSVLKNQ